MRLLLESYLHPASSFITLTYEQSYAPYKDIDYNVPILCKKDVQDFLKRLRDDFQRNSGFSGGQIRYYFAGEYGPKGHLPHYHGILFGVSPFELDDQWMYYAGRSGPFKPNYCRPSRLYNNWKWGIVHVGEVTRESIQYCAGYVLKKLTRKGDGLEPEFQLMSRRPGIGALAVPDIARVLQKVSRDCGQPYSGKEIHIGGKSYPLGRYLLSQLRNVSDLDTGLDSYTESLRDIFRAAKSQGDYFGEFLTSSTEQKYLNLEAKQKVFDKRNKL